MPSSITLPNNLINGKRTYDGATVPTSPNRGDFWRERDVNGDLVMEWVWDATYWLSKELLSFTLVSQGVSASTTLIAFSPKYKSYNLFFVNYEISDFIATTNDSTNYWNLSLVRQNTAGSLTQIGATISTMTITPATWNTQAAIVNIFLDSAATDARTLRISATKILSPGTLIFAFTVFYRLARP